MKRFRIHLSGFCLFLIVLALTTPFAVAAETDVEPNSGAPVTEESQPNDLVMLNAVINNPDLAKHSDGDERYDCFWVTQADGQHVSDLEVGQIYTAHLYLRASGMADGMLTNLHVSCIMQEDPLRMVGGCDVLFENIYGALTRDSYNCLAMINEGILCRPYGEPHARIGDQLVNPNGQFYNIDRPKVDMMNGLEFAELRVGRENAIEITFEFLTESWEEYRSLVSPVSDYETILDEPIKVSPSQEATSPDNVAEALPPCTEAAEQGRADSSLIAFSAFALAVVPVMYCIYRYSRRHH